MIEHSGWSNVTYDIPAGCRDVDDLILTLQMNWHLANILKAAWRYGKKCMPGKSLTEAKRYDLEKIIWMARRELEALDRLQQQAGKISPLVPPDKAFPIYDGDQYIKGYAYAVDIDYKGPDS